MSDMGHDYILQLFYFNAASGAGACQVEKDEHQEDLTTKARPPSGVRYFPELCRLLTHFPFFHASFLDGCASCSCAAHPIYFPRLLRSTLR